MAQSKFVICIDNSDLFSIVGNTEAYEAIADADATQVSFELSICHG